MNLDEHLSKDQYTNLLNTAIKTGCSYFTFNIPNTICNECAFITKHKINKCPACGSENLDSITRVIGLTISPFVLVTVQRKSCKLLETPKAKYTTA